jgi:hypothetical protein
LDVEIMDGIESMERIEDGFEWFDDRRDNWGRRKDAGPEKGTKAADGSAGGVGGLLDE